MRRTAAVFSGVALALAGCGDDGDEAATSAAETSPPPSATEPPPATTETTPGARDAEAAFRAFFAAAARGDTAAVWEALTATAQQRLGPTQQEFAAGAAGPLEQGLANVDPDEAETLVAEAFPGGRAVVAVTVGENVFATPLRREGGDWKVDVGGAVSVEPEAPRPGGSPSGPLIRARVDAAAPPSEARIWLDGRPLPTTVGAAGLIAAPLGGLDPGRHTVVAYAQTEADAAATTWTFELDG